MSASARPRTRRTRSTTRALVSVAIVLAALAAGIDADVRAQGRVRAHVRLVVLGERFPASWIDPIVVALERDLAVQVIGPPTRLPLPNAAYYPPRRRYRADALLEFLRAQLGPSPSARILGLTARDISTRTERFEDWGILGLADLGGPACVVSSFRMRRRARDEAHALWRMTTTVVHEMGHALGLPHCDETRCVMRDANGTIDTVDDGDGSLGPSCLRRLDHESPAVHPRIE